MWSYLALRRANHLETATQSFAPGEPRPYLADRRRSFRPNLLRAHIVDSGGRIGWVVHVRALLQLTLFGIGATLIVDPDHPESRYGPAAGGLKTS